MKGDLGVERVVALADGRAAVIVPPRLGAAGFLSLIDERGQERRVPLKLPHDEAAGEALLEKGLWLDGFRELSGGALGGWVAGAGPFVGVRVALDGAVTVSRPEIGIDRALLSGSHGLVVGRTGRAMESTDGGFEWSEVELPSEFDASKEPRDDARLQGCSELGCAFAGFVRVGWKSGSATPPLSIAKLPEMTPLIQPGGGRWLLHCDATGEVSDGAAPLGARTHSSAAARTAWRLGRLSTSSRRRRWRPARSASTPRPWNRRRRSCTPMPGASAALSGVAPDTRKSARSIAFK